MLLNKYAPGIYVEEVPGGAWPITTANTAVLAMIGFVNPPKPDKVESEEAWKPWKPHKVTSWANFVNTFGELDREPAYGCLYRSILGYFNNGGAHAWVVGIPMAETVESLPQPPGEALLRNRDDQPALRLGTLAPYSEEGEITLEVKEPETGQADGGFTLVIRAGRDEQTIRNLTLGGKTKTLKNVADVLVKESNNRVKVLEVLADAVPLAAQMVPLKPKQEALARLQAEGQADTAATAAQFRAITAERVAAAEGEVSQRTGIAGLEAIDDITLLAFPDLMLLHSAHAVGDELVKHVQTAMIDHCAKMKNRFAVLDCPAKKGVADMCAWVDVTMNFDSDYAALYYPWIKVGANKVETYIPPSGHVAGVYARVDGERGVHKAPANEAVRGALDLEINVTQREQESLNPIGVNCIRSFPGRGIRIWGARTLARTRTEWTYINVRRLFSSIEEAILQGTQWAVFEPNDPILWAAIRREVGAYLTQRWREGALFGNTPEEAFYVKCDGELNTQDVRDRGYCLIEVGIAPVKPAEFIVFYVKQIRDGGSTTSE